jgi:uncharacterized protein
VIALDRVIELPVAPHVAWETLWDVSRLASCIPGCEDVQEVEPRSRYRATVRDRVGPFKVTIPLDVVITSLVEDSRLSVSASGRDATLGSPVKMELSISLESTAGGARLSLRGGGEVGGKLAALGQAVTQRKTRDTLDRFATNLERLLQGPAGAAAV